LRFPYKLKEPSRIFVNSMSDCFNDAVPDDFINQIFTVMDDTPRHTFQILTKRPERAATWPGPWGPNIWMGTSVEDARVLKRVDELRRCAATTKFISAEPLIGPLTGLDLTGIDWVILGGESGPGFRGMDMQWCRDIRDLCVGAGVALFFKQQAAYRTETRPYLVEADATCWQWHQMPGSVEPPSLVEPDNPAKHRELFPILV
jgi:protein gp37